VLLSIAVNGDFLVLFIVVCIGLYGVELIITKVPYPGAGSFQGSTRGNSVSIVKVFEML